MPQPTDAATIQLAFFEWVFGEEQGWLSICTANPDMEGWRERFVRWPDEQHNIAGLISVDRHAWFCTSLLKDRKRSKPNCLPGSLVWSDLDRVDPTGVTPRPSVVLQSSPSSYQAFARLASTVPAEVAEDFSRRWAYANGADKTGWPLTKLLRIPYTYNHKSKYLVDGKAPLVDFVREFQITDTLVPIGVFDDLPMPSVADVTNGATTGDADIGEPPAPDDLEEALQIIHRFRNELVDTGFHELFSLDPGDDDNWSARLWRLEKICAEVGMVPIEIFSVALESRCNKYERDNRPVSFLWREVNKAFNQHRAVAQIVTGTNEITELIMPTLVDDVEAAKIEDTSFISDYKAWAADATDAPLIFHELSCFMALSALVSDKLRVETTFGSMPPNLWGLLLGESSLSRKTTAMKLAMNIVQEIDPELIIATQAGSPEGLLTSLSVRPSKVSVFFKDEISGFFETISKRDYLAGYTELLTELYDAPKVPITRPLRKETITVVEPYFIFFGGGIRNKVHSLITEGMITGGFLPRFLVVASDVDIDNLKPVGPPGEQSLALKETVLDFFKGVHATYDKQAENTIHRDATGKPPITWNTQQKFEARLTTEAWTLWNQYEQTMIREGNNSHLADLALPTFQRLAFSLLKLAMLVAVSRRMPDENNILMVDVNDVKQSAWYIQRWGEHSINLIANANKPKLEHLLDRVLKYIRDHPMCMRSEVSQRFRLDRRDMTEAEETLMMRGLINKYTEGKRTVKYMAVI